jgi:hypothetical protein
MKYKLSILAIIAILLWGQAVFAFSIIKDDNSSISKESLAPKITVINESVSGIDVEINLPAVKSRNISVEGQDYQILDIPGGGHIDKPGYPFLPTVSTHIEIPRQASVSIEELEYISEVFEGYNVYPAQEHFFGPSQDENKFVKDTTAYSTDKFFPLNKYNTAKPVVLRGHKLVMLAVYPVRVNPVTNQLEVITNLKLRLNFDKAAAPSSKTRSKAAKYESETVAKDLHFVFNRFILNYKSGPQEVSSNKSRYMNNLTSGADYLIITHDSFYSQMIPFKELKEAKGLSVKIVSVSQIGTDPSAEDITAYIKNAYETWQPAPMYLLLVGDTNLIPIHQITENLPSTDLYYGTVDGDDFWPDIFIGRLPVRTPQELDIVISKIIEYETSFNPQDTWRNKILLASSYEAEKYFIDTSEEISIFLQSSGYDCKNVYTGGNYDGTTEDVVEYINEGVFIVNHMNHGTPEGWEHPKFKISDIPSLTNKDKLPVMFSINCSSGRFDREEDCFGEALIKAQNNGKNTGVIGFIGAIRDSYVGYSNELNKGIFACIWPQFYDGYANAAGSSDKLGVILNFAKFFMFDKYFVTNGAGYWSADLFSTVYAKPSLRMVQAEFELFHLLGDPELSILGNVPFPVAINISSSDSIEYSGDGDGHMDSGETFDLVVELKSYNFNAQGVSAVLKTDDEYVTIENNNVYFGDILLGNPVTNEDNPYRFSISKDCPKGHRIKFVLSIKAVDYETERAFFTKEIYQFWPVKTDGLIYSSPAVADINGDGAVEILFGSEDGNVYCVGKGDKKLWQFETGDDVRSSVTVDDLIEENEGLEIVFGSYDYKLYCLDKDGQKLWDFSTQEKIHSSPIIVDILPEIEGKEIIFGSWDGRVYCLGRYGNKLWEYETEGGVWSSPVAGNINEDEDLEVVIGSTDHKLYCLNKNGQKLWDYETMSAVYVSPTIADIDSGIEGLEIVFGSSDSRFYCLDKEGSKLWQFQTQGEEIVMEGELDTHSEGQSDNSGGYNYQYSIDDKGEKMTGPDLTWDQNYGIRLKLLPDNSLLIKAKFMNIGDTFSNFIYKVKLKIFARERVFMGNIQDYEQEKFIFKGVLYPKESQLFSYHTEKISDSGQSGIFPDFNKQYVGIELFVNYGWRGRESNKENNIIQGSLRNSIDSSAAVADINDNGNLEIVFGSNDEKLYCLNNKGNLIWDFETRNGIIRGAPSIADIFPETAGLEIVFGSWEFINHLNGAFFCLDSEGNELWKNNTVSGIQSSPAIVDLNPSVEDGLELLFGSYNEKMYCLDRSGEIFKRDIEITGVSNFAPWPMFRHDSRGTSRYEGQKILFYGPDLVVEDIYDDQNKLSIIIKNQGNKAVPDEVGHLFVWIDGQLCGTYSLSALYSQVFRQPGGEIIVQPQFLYGKHKIRVEIDPKNKIVELDEKNNIKEKDISFNDRNLLPLDEGVENKSNTDELEEENKRNRSPVALGVNAGKKDYKLEKDNQGWFWFLGKQYIEKKLVD